MSKQLSHWRKSRLAEQGGQESAGQERGEAGSEKEPLSQELWD